MRVIYFKSTSGREPAREYVEQLPEKDRAIITRDIERLIELGLSNNPYVVTRKIMGGRFSGRLWEIKTGTGSQQRIFYCLIAGPTMVLLHACKKQKNEGQVTDLEVALRRMKEALS